MLLYKNHRLYHENFSFAIPNGFFLDTEHNSECPDETVNLVSEDMRFAVQLSILYQTGEAADELAHIIMCINAYVIEAVKPFTINGLHGCCATYTSDGDYYHELRLDLDDGEDGINEFLVIIRTEDVIESQKDVAAIIRLIEPRRED